MSPTDRHEIRLPARTALELLDGGSAAFPRMLAAIAGARREVHLEVYSLSPTGVGAEFIAALAAAGRRGVQVRVVLDAWGTGRATRRIAATLRGAGCHVRVFNPMLAGLLGRFRRNHRKVLLVDDELAFLGGLNIGDEFVGTDGWADLAVELRGPACVALGRRLRHELKRAPLADEAAERHANLEPPNDARVLLSGIGGGRRLRKRYLKAFGRATSRVLLAHCYFLPDRGLLRSITAAARRGVAVTLLLPGRSDVPLVRASTTLFYRRLLGAGVKIYEHTGSILHSKVAVVDGERLLVGSFNLDPFSLVDLEILLEARDATAARGVEAWIERRLVTARPITLTDCELPPLRGLWLRLGGSLGRGIVAFVRAALALR
jgi:cardiolipin synthase